MHSPQRTHFFKNSSSPVTPGGRKILDQDNGSLKANTLGRRNPETALVSITLRAGEKTRLGFLTIAGRAGFPGGKGSCTSFVARNARERGWLRKEGGRRKPRGRRFHEKGADN